MEKNKIMALAVIAIVLAAAAGFVFLQQGKDSSSTDKNDPENTVKAFVEAFNDHDGQAALNQTTDRFMGNEAHDYWVGKMAYYASRNLTFNLTALTLTDDDDAPVSAIALRIDKLQNDSEQKIDDWAVVHVVANLTSGVTNYPMDSHCLMVKIDGVWYMDYDSLSTDIGQWYEAWSS